MLPLPSKAPCSSSKTSRINDGGWLGGITYHDLTEIFYGSPRLTGYLNYQKSISPEKMGLPVPGRTCWIDQPSDYLAEFSEKKIQYYLGRSMVYWDGEKYLLIPLTVRGTKKYQAKIGRKFDLLKDFMAENNLPAVHVRLSPYAPYGASQLDSLLGMKETLNPFLSFIQKKIGLRPLYVWAVEPTERGHCHYHILFIGMNYLMQKHYLDEWFESRGLGNKSGVWIENLRDSKEASEKILGYLIKYISKPSKDPYWSGLLGLTRKREWGMSSRLRFKLIKFQEERKRPSVFTCTVKSNSNLQSTWEYIGTYDNVLIEALMGDSPPSPEEFKSDLAEIYGGIRALRERHWNT